MPLNFVILKAQRHVLAVQMLVGQRRKKDRWQRRRLETLREKDYGDELKSIAIISIIVPTSFYDEGGYKERKLYKRKTKEADIRLRIDYNEFIHASEEERLNIYNNHIVQSIRTLQKKLEPDFDYPRLEEDVKQALCMRENNCDQRNWEEEEGQL